MDAAVRAIGERQAAWLTQQMKAREESYTEERDVGLFCGTWNVKERPPSESLLPWLQPALDCSVCCISLQVQHSFFFFDSNILKMQEYHNA